MITTRLNTRTINLANEKASECFANRLASSLHPFLPETLHLSQDKIKALPLVMSFSGDLGTGKTTIIRAMLKGIGIQSRIKSPTFSLVESYVCQGIQVHHFDLYRIDHEEELEYLGFRDYFTPDSVCCIEWAEKAGKSLPNVDIRFKLSIKGAEREMHIQALSTAGKKILTHLVGGT